MTAPERIWIDAWGGNWSPTSGGTQGIEYIRADLVPAAALAVPEVELLLDAYKGLLVLHRLLDRAGLTAGVKATDAIADRIVAAHPEFPARTTIAEVQE